jgi:hypothetical protein
MKIFAAALCTFLCSAPVFAEVTRVTIASRSAVANEQPFGATGAYEKLTGTIEFALDPRNPQNTRIVDLDRSDRAGDGRVHFTADLVVLRPVDPARGNGVLLFEVVNRGRIGLLTRFNSAPGAIDPATPTDFGNGYLMREGYTLVMVGWEFDIPPGTIRLDAPRLDGLVEPIRVSFVLDREADEASLEDAPMYSPVDPADAASTLTVRDHYWNAPTQIARGRWRFVTGAAGPARLALDGGFEPGRMYEVAFKARGARVVGTGLAAIRDAASAFRYRTDLPIQGKAAYAFGVSQVGRFLRQFLYDGFNADERGRRVFDAVWSHIAGSARGTFNERFGMPVAGSVLLTPTSFPFTTDEQSFAGERGSLLQHYSAEQRPKIFFTNTSVEYWGGGRAAALIHTSADGKRDLAVPDNVRIYLLAGTQHGEAAFPPSRARGQQMDNPVPQREVMRALLRGLHQWTSEGIAPPESRYPKLADGTLTSIDGVRFPAIPAVADPRIIPGPGQIRNGRVRMLPHLVPQVDPDGNETGGIRVPDIAVPVATNTGWNLRSASVGGSTEIYNLLGSYVPFALTKAEREARKDPRPSIAERHRSREDYLTKLRAAAEALVTQRYLLAEDVQNVVERGEAQWQFVTSRTTTSSR